MMKSELLPELHSSFVHEIVFGVTEESRDFAIKIGPGVGGDGPPRKKKK